MRRWPRSRCARSARRCARAGPACGEWRSCTVRDAWRSASPPSSSPSRPLTVATPSTPAATPSTPSSAPCPSGRRSTSRMARSGSVFREASLLDIAGRAVHRHGMLAAGETVLVGVSGGADSVALLHTLVVLAPSLGVSVRVLHVDHGLRAGSARDADVVRRLGARLGVPVEVARVTVGDGSVEAAARAARYAALEAAADRTGAARIAVGHTADDQAETVLMRVLEGSGVRGLAGMAAVRGRIIRPLLDARRADVVAALEGARLPWIEDASNRDARFFRNRIRHQILPAIAGACEGDVVEALTRVGDFARESLQTVERMAEAELERLAAVEPDALTLSRAA